MSGKRAPVADKGTVPSSTVLTKIAWKLKESGVPAEKFDRDGLAYILGGIFEKYEQRRSAMSRDTMPTAPELAHDIQAVRKHLIAICEVLADNIHVAEWLDEFVKEERPADMPESMGAFHEAFFRCLDAAKNADAHFASATARGEALMINCSDRSIEHRKRTRTDARDTVLIPALVAWLRLAGLQLHDTEQGPRSWDLEALDVACEIIELVLDDWGVAIPQSGDTGRGEKHQGRLRRMVKAAWNALPAG